MAFNRKVSLIIGIGDNDAVNKQGLEIADLDIEFDVTRSRTLAENTAKFKVYNLSEKTRQNNLKQGAGIIFSAGYEDEGTGVLFTGAIDKIDYEKQDGNFITNISGVSFSGDNNLENSPVSISYAKDGRISEIITDIADALSLPVYGIKNADIKLIHNFTFAGTARAALRRLEWMLAVEGIKIMIDNGELIVYKEFGESLFEAFILDYTSGLVSAVPKVDDKDKNIVTDRVIVTSLIVPKMRPGTLFKVSGDYVNGAYIAEKVQAVGSTFGDQYEMITEAKA